MRIERFEDGERCELRIRGDLQLGEARELLERVLQEDCARVVLDFSGCEVEDRALSALAELLTHAHLRLAVRGLRERQVRLLEYLGASRSLEQIP
jgi:anti-anti-sigma regulatory factor